MMNLVKTYKRKIINQHRIDRILNDYDFKFHCHNLRKQPDFNEIFKLVEKIAQIDISNISIDNSLIENQRLFQNEEIIKNGLEFYKFIDKCYPNKTSLEKLFLENMKYLITENNAKDSRSFCEYRRFPECTIRKIYVNFEDRISDIQTLTHEFCHSFSRTFTGGVRENDKNMSEVPPVICDQLTIVYLMNKYPNLKKNLLEYSIFTQIQNVKKARISLLECLVVKVMCNEIKLDDAIKKYGHLYKDFPYLIDQTLNRIENFKFNDILLESKYLIPQMIALEMRDRLAISKEKTLCDFKALVEQEHSLTIDDTLKFLNLEDKEVLIDSYINKFHTRIANYTKNKIKEEKQEKVVYEK